MKKHVVWTDEMEDFIVSSDEIASNEEVADILGVSMSALYNRRCYLRGLGKLPKHAPKTKLSPKKEAERQKRLRRRSEEEEKELKLWNKRHEKLLEKHKQELKKEFNRVENHIQELNLKEGRKYVVKSKRTGAGHIAETFKGKLAKIYDDHIRLCGSYNRCYLKCDLMTGEYTIEEGEE